MIAFATGLALIGFSVPFAQEESDYYTLDYLTPPTGEVLEVAGMDFLDETTLLVSTRRGRVWWIENALAEDPKDARFHIYCEGLFEGLGLRVVDGDIFVVQRSELSKLVDIDGDKICDRIETISQGWGMSGNYHEFAFGLPMDAEGNFFVSTNVGFSSPEWWLGTSTEPYRGWISRISPEGEFIPWASGVRSPAGLGEDSKGNLYYTDNQGDWMPVCGLFRVQKGDFFGHPASLRWRDDWHKDGPLPSMTEPPQVERTPPALWIPYEWSRSTGSLVEDRTAGKFGPFEGNLFLAELTNGMVVRAMLEDVEGHMQGACVPFRQKVGSAFRVEFASDGTLFSGFTNRGWGGLAPGSGISRIRWTGKVPTEVNRVALKADGFEVHFTKSMQSTPSAEQIKVYDYDYNWWWDYGSPMMNQRDLTVSSVEVMPNGIGMRIHVEGLEAGRNVRVRIPGLLHEEFDYTIHRMPGSPKTIYVAKEVEPPVVNQNPDEGWLTLTWLDPFDAWISEGWELVNAELDANDPTKLVTTPGNGALVNTGHPAAGFQSKAEFGDIEFRFSFMLPQDGDSGLYFMGRYELQLIDNPDQCLGLIGGKNPRAKGYRGPGEWHVITGKFFAPRFDGDGKKISNARFDQIQADGVMVIGSSEVGAPTPGGVGMDEVPMGPLFFQGNAGMVAMGDIRVRVIVEGEPEFEGGGWQPLDDFNALEGLLADHMLAVAEDPGAHDRVSANVKPEHFYPFELQGTFQVSDMGSAALHFGPGKLMLDHNSSGAAKTGSLIGFGKDLSKPVPEPAGGITRDRIMRTQLMQPGVPCHFRLVADHPGDGQESPRLRVWLNGALMNRADFGHAPLNLAQMHIESLPGTEVSTQNLMFRFLPPGTQ